MSPAVIPPAVTGTASRAMSRRAPIKAEPRLPVQAAEQGLSVGQLMGRARASLLTTIDAELERFGLNSTQFAVLKHLGEGTARTAADLCRINRYDTGAMTRILDRLEEKGLVRRERCREDRRVVDAHLAGFSANEIEALKGYLHRMIDNGQARADNQRSLPGRKP